MDGCSNCEKTENVISCDGCQKILCDKCSELSPSEIKCMPLKKRKLLFLCNECEHGFKLIPVLFKKVESLEETVQKLKDDANNCTIRSQPVPELTTNTPLSNSELMHEFENRTKRTKNVMIYNVNEITSRMINERINHDTNEVNNILTTLGITENPIKIIRLGKATGKPIPLKVIMHTQQAVTDCLKNRKNLTGTIVRISADLIILQRQGIKNYMRKLNQRRENGENDIQIRYIGGVPKILKTPVNASNSSKTNQLLLPKLRGYSH
ncbi:hypothetical protein JTB14_011878 [Gonioctena quinquepunctata]|nr:hypothetical protein JTB14_011878 [Gonioctena quinquepunctata]